MHNPDKTLLRKYIAFSLQYVDWPYWERFVWGWRGENCLLGCKRGCHAVQSFGVWVKVKITILLLSSLCNALSADPHLRVLIGISVFLCDMFNVRFFTEKRGWSGVEIASYSADPAPGHQSAERFSGVSMVKQVACKEGGSCVLSCMKEHTLWQSCVHGFCQNFCLCLSLSDVEVSVVTV